MNGMDWFAQILLAGVFFFDGFRRIFVCSLRNESQPHRPRSNAISLPFGVTCIVGLIEMAGALGLVVPVHSWQPNVLPILAASVLALLTGTALVYHLYRRQPAAPVVVLFLLVLLAIIGRWA